MGGLFGIGSSATPKIASRIYNLFLIDCHNILYYTTLHIQMDRLKHQTFAQRFLNCVNGIICSLKLNIYIAAPSINDLWGEFICFLNDPNCLVWRKVGMKTTEMPRKHHSKGSFLLTVLSALTGNKLGDFSTWFPSCIIAGKTFTILHTPSPHVFTRGAKPGYIHSHRDLETSSDFVFISSDFLLSVSQHQA